MDIQYTDKLPLEVELYSLYELASWNDFLQLTKEDLHKAVRQSWYVYSAYNERKLVGTGRIISDGVINAYLCGLVVHPDYQKLGIGKKIMTRMINQAKEHNLHIQLFCSENLVPYYRQQSFDVFATGMKYNG